MHFPVHHIPALGPIIDHLQVLLQHGGYWIIAAAAVLESLPLVGSIIPGHTIVILGGFFARLGFLNIYIVMLIAAVGSVTGDCVAYFLGKKYGLALITKWSKYFLVTQENIDRARAVIGRHTGKALIIGRFNPITRAFTPFLVGAGGGHWRAFWIYDSIAGLSWAILSVGVGYIFGASFHVVESFIGRFTTVGIVIALLIALSYYFINKRRHLFSRGDLYLLFASLFSLVVFFKTIQDVFSVRPFFVNLDVAVNMATARHIIPFFVIVAKIVSDVISPTTLSIVCVGLTIWFLAKKYRHNFYIILAAFPAGLIFDYVMKVAVARPRPVNMLVPLTDFSFPSGHATAIGLFATLMVYFFARYIRNRHTREFFIVANVFLVVVVCAARVYLNVHWFSDVVAGATFGVFWATFSILVVRYVEGLTTGRGAKEVIIKK